MERLPEKTAGQTLTDYAETLTKWYVENTNIQYRKKAGQYFTPVRISEFMVRQYEDFNKEEIRILDPGAGIGIFESSFCEYLKSLDKKIKIVFDLYENDPNIVPILSLNMKACQEDMIRKGFDISYRVFNDDFVLSNVPTLNNQNENHEADQTVYDLVIANPPYYRLRKGSPQLVRIKSIVDGPPNIYPLFMALAAKLLKNGGQMTALTPRSYCSGWYYRKFRNWFLGIVKPYKIHVFESRKEVFKEYGVLQENVILSAKKTLDTPKDVMISVSRGIPNQNEEQNVRHTPYERVVVRKHNDLVIRIPTSMLGELISAYIDKFKNDLNSLGFKVSTGPVVPFRAKDFLSTETSGSSVPLIWMHNIVNGVVRWPLEKENKPTRIRKTRESKSILIPSRNYVLVKRFSTKEGKQRINAGIYLRDTFDSDYIGIENHVNYIYKKEGELTINETYGLAALLNSKLYNIYFQVSNGNTQVNATEINSLPLPSLETIREIGNSVRNLEKEDTILKEHAIMNTLRIDKVISRGLTEAI